MIALLTLIALLKPTVGVPFLVVVAFERLVGAVRDPATPPIADFPAMVATIALWTLANRLWHGGPWGSAWLAGLEHYPHAIPMGQWGSVVWAHMLLGALVVGWRR